MTGVRVRGETIRRFIIENVGQHPNDISKFALEHFGISRQAVNGHLNRLVAEGALTKSGKTRNHAYTLCPLAEWQGMYPISPGLAEDVVWRNEVSAAMGHLPDNVLNIWHYGFTEMFNNAIDHSGSADIHVWIRRTSASTEMIVQDNGIGIFKKIQSELKLLDERHAILELSKGKLTTDPARHSGEGIFFSSRMFDNFYILSGGVYFSHKFEKAEDWILELDKSRKGTWVLMELFNHTARTAKKIFDQYSSGDDYGFNKTVVPVKLAQYGNDNLISRSQAKRLLARVELFKTVMLNFEGVDAIGQAFADEIFRVFAKSHPGIALIPYKMNSQVKRMVGRAKG